MSRGNDGTRHGRIISVCGKGGGREILKFGISLWHIDKHIVLLTARERERERERDREI